MSTDQIAHLKRQYYTLKAERNMYAGYAQRTSKLEREHWYYIQQQESLQKEMNRIVHQIRA